MEHQTFSVQFAFQFDFVGVGLNSETNYATARQFVLKEPFIKLITTV